MAASGPALDVRSTVYHLNASNVGPVELHVEERGSGRPVLLLHGGAGPNSWARFAPMLAARTEARVMVPTHPGFALTPRPDALRTIPGLAAVYSALLGELGQRATVVGNSIGGWIAAELAARSLVDLEGLVLISAAGVEVPDRSIPDVSKLSLDELMALSYHDPAPFRIDPTKMTDGQRAVAASNRAALQLYAPVMTDPSLAGRLGGVHAPTLVISGAADRVVPSEFGRAFAAAIPGARFVEMPKAGHLPQIEAPEALFETLRANGQLPALRSARA